MNISMIVRTVIAYKGRSVISGIADRYNVSDVVADVLNVLDAVEDVLVDVNIGNMLMMLIAMLMDAAGAIVLAVAVTATAAAVVVTVAVIAAAVRAIVVPGYTLISDSPADPCFCLREHLV